MALGGSDGPARGLPVEPAREFSADEVARRHFRTSFRGFDQHEVRAYLGLLADELRRLRASLDALQTEMTTLRAAPPPTPDRATLMTALGEETARIVATAEEAAADIRAKAEETAARLRAEAEADAEAMRSEAGGTLQARRDEADAEVAGRLREAEEQAARITEEARRIAEQMVREAEAERDGVLAELAERRRATHVQVERLGAGRDRLLEAYAAVRRNLDEAVGTLDSAPEEARRAAEAAASQARRNAPPAPRRERPRIEAPLPAPESQPEPVPAIQPEPVPEPTPVPVPVQPEPAPEPAPEAQPAPAPEPEPSAEKPEVEVAPDAPEAVAAEAFALLRAQRQPEAADEVPDTVKKPASAEEPEVAPQPDDEPDVQAEAELQKRDASIDPVLTPLIRRIKRQLQDEQNDVLDLIRNSKGAPTVESALGTDDGHAAKYEALVHEAVAAVGRTGAESTGSNPTDIPGLRSISAALAQEVTRPVRRSLSRALGSGTDDDEQALADGVGAAYREWRTARIEKLASDHLSAAYVAGVFAAATGRRAVWVVDDGGEPCPDCDDNALAGPTTIGDAFPTGQKAPPAHPGCRCLLVPQ